LRVHGYTVLPPPLWSDDFEESIGADGVRMMTKAWEQLSKKARNAAAQPGGISRQELEQRMRLPQPVLTFLVNKVVADGHLKLVEGFYLPTAAPETYMSPVAQRLLSQLNSAAERGIDLETEHNPLYEKTYRALARMGLGVATETPWVYGLTGWSQLRSKLCGPGTLGREWRIAEVKDVLDVSRKPILGILNKLEEEGWLERKEDHRLVVKEVPAL
jgi:selenocysteine-specific elongation factor